MRGFGDRYLTAASLALLVLLAGRSAAQAQVAAATVPAAPVAQQPYNPSMADLMNMAVQPRHAKIGLAGRARNWSYLTYETKELVNAFNRIARTIPSFNGADTAALFESQIKQPLDRMDSAIKARDPARFDAAYANLTDSCNLCHRALAKDWIVIKAPDAGMFGNQDFRGQAAKP